jgi:hypothetical protein
VNLQQRRRIVSFSKKEASKLQSRRQMGLGERVLFLDRLVVSWDYICFNATGKLN